VWRFMTNDIEVLHTDELVMHTIRYNIRILLTVVFITNNIPVTD
jgi:hypothetical protein